MANLKNAQKKGEMGGKSRGAGKAPMGGKMTVDTNEESTGTINKKHFGHVLSTAAKLHGSDPGFGQHKR